MRKHELKLLPDFWGRVESGLKPFELRYNDRAFQVGDDLVLREWSPELGYTGRVLRGMVTYTLTSLDLRDTPMAMALTPGWVILGLPEVARCDREVACDVEC